MDFNRIDWSKSTRSSLIILNNLRRFLNEKFKIAPFFFSLDRVVRLVVSIYQTFLHKHFNNQYICIPLQCVMVERE